MPNPSTAAIHDGPPITVIRADYGRPGTLPGRGDIIRVWLRSGDLVLGRFRAVVPPYDQSGLVRLVDVPSGERIGYLDQGEFWCLYDEAPNHARVDQAGIIVEQMLVTAPGSDDAATNDPAQDILNDREKPRCRAYDTFWVASQLKEVFDARFYVLHNDPTADQLRLREGMHNILQKVAGLAADIEDMDSHIGVAGYAKLNAEILEIARADG